MVYFLIDDSYVIESKKNNSSYFFSKGLIPINISYRLNKIPYYENSRYYYRDLIELIKNDNLQKKPKPINKTSRLNTIYYNPKKTKGKIISYEYIPINISFYFPPKISIYLLTEVPWQHWLGIVEQEKVQFLTYCRDFMILN